MKCDECNNANICLDHIEFPSLGGCTSGMPDRKVITNADRIRNMSDEELADWIYYHNTKFSSEKQWIDWLQSEAE